MRWAKVIADTPGHRQPVKQPVKQPVIQPVSTLQKLLKQCPDVFEQGRHSIEDYVERNISPELHKATALMVFSIAVIDDDGIETILASSRGKSIKKPYSLIKNEEFCVSARKFVKENACRKGVPNLTVEME